MNKSLRNICVVCVCSFVFFCFQLSVGQEIMGVQGLTDAELEGSVWNLAGRAQVQSAPAHFVFRNNVYRREIAGVTNFFIVKGDSVVWTGYNVGRRLGVVADRPVLVRRLSDPGSRSGSYTARGTLDVSLRLNERGTYDFNVLRAGKAIIAPGDTLADVFLSRDVRSYVVGLNDSVSSDSARIVTYNWFKSGASVPFAVQQGDVLYVDASGVNIEPDSDSDSDSGEDVDAASVIERAKVEVSDGRVHVLLPRAVAVHVYVMDAPGHIYAHASGRDASFELDVTGLPHNTYIISIVWQDNPEILHKLITRL